MSNVCTLFTWWCSGGNGNIHSFVVLSLSPFHIVLLFLVIVTSFFVNVVMQSSSQSFAMDISECFFNPGNIYPLVAIVLNDGICSVHCLFVVRIVPFGMDTVMCCLIVFCFPDVSVFRKCEVGPESAIAYCCCLFGGFLVEVVASKVLL